MIQQTAVIALYDIHRLDFLMVGRPVPCGYKLLPYIRQLILVFRMIKKNNIIHQIVFKFSFSLPKKKLPH